MSRLVAPTALLKACARIAPELGLEPKTSETALRIALRDADPLAEDIYGVSWGVELTALLKTSARIAPAEPAPTARSCA